MDVSLDRTAAPAFDGIFIRVSILVTALVILFLRMPTTLLIPQFWGEDAPLFYQQAVDRGLHGLFLPAAGYFVVLQLLIGVLSSYFPITLAPAVMTYSAVAITLYIVWLATSPRFDVPYRPLIALAIVAVPAGYEVLGTAANTQWIAPVGAFILLFMRPHPDRRVTAFEIAFVAVVAFTGPCSIFLTPLSVALTWLERDRLARRRLLQLTGVLLLGLVVTGVYVFIHRQEAMNPPGIPVMQFDPEFWITLPLAKVTESFGPIVNRFFAQGANLIPSGVLIVLVAYFGLRQPYRTLKISMLFLGAAFMFSGMLKYRASLPFLANTGSTRYFYAASVFFLWFICCAPKNNLVRAACGIGVAIVELFCVTSTFDTPRNRTDFEWPVWAAYALRGLPLFVPTTPVSWGISEPAGAGDLSKFNAWIGGTLASKVSEKEAGGCSGSIDIAQPYQSFNSIPKLWMMRGQAWNTALNKPFHIVALTDAEDRVLGYGIPGFKNAVDPQHPQSGWVGIFPTPEPSVVNAYGLTADGQRACMVGRFVPPVPPVNLTEGPFTGGTPLNAGSRIAQRFKPAYPTVQALSVAVIAWGKEPGSYKVHWRISALSNDKREDIGSGEILTQGLQEWQLLRLPVSKTYDFRADDIEIEFTVDSKETTSPPIGLPMFQPRPGETVPALQIDGSQAPDGRVLGMTLHYGR